MTGTCVPDGLISFDDAVLNLLLFRVAWLRERMKRVNRHKQVMKEL